MTRLALSDVHDDVTTGFSTLAGSVVASERNITSTIEEIRTLGVRQSEDMQNLSARLQGSRQRGLYKGSVWDIIPGDIHIIEPVTRSSTKCRVVRYQDSYCTIENSDTRKVIRKYQTSDENREDAMKQLDQALDFFMKQRHPNLPQIFGVCRSPDFPAIIFLLHGTTRVPFRHYIHDLPAMRFIQFYFDLFQDLQSVSEVLPIESYRYPGDRYYYVYDPVSEITNDFLCIIIVSKVNEEQVYVNEYGKLVFGDLLCYNHYRLGPFEFSYTPEHGKYSLGSIARRRSGEPLHSQVGRRKPSFSNSQKGDLQDAYKTIIPYHNQSPDFNEIQWTQTFNRHRLQPPQYRLNDQTNSVSSPYQKALYAPGSIFCNLEDRFSPRRVLVGRARPWPHGWKSEIFQQKGPSRGVIDLPFDNGSVSIELSWDDVIRNPSIRIHTRPRWEDSDEIASVGSWIAQTSKLDSCLRSRGYGDDLEAYIITGVEFPIEFVPKYHRSWYGDKDFCHICNAKDRSHHALSLSITAPIIDFETNVITSWPVISCSRVCGMDLLEEEDIFTVQVYGYELQKRWGFERYMVHLTIPELNAEHGFDPACDGADVCEYFGWPLLEILDPSTGEWVLNGTTSQPSGPASVIMPGQILSREHDSAPRSTVGVATGRIAEETQAGEVPTIESRMDPVVQHDISTRALIVIFIAICIQVILLSSFKNYL